MTTPPIDDLDTSPLEIVARPSDARWRARLRATAEVLLCSGIPTQLLVAQGLAFGGIRPFGPGGDLDATWVFLLALVDTVLILTLAILLLRANGESPRDVFLGPRPFTREAIIGIALIGPLVLGVAAIILAARALWPSLHNVPDNPLAGLLRSPGDAALFAVVAMVGGGVREEIQRAFLLTRFERHLGGPTVGLVVTSVAFGAGHALQGWDAAVATSMMGLFWGWVYLRRRSVAAPIVSHAGFNSLEIVRFLLVGPGGV
jgi:membrane protease YdiL (CAAX protease family)